jgi:type II secretory pathway pseudopilin PulG
MNSAIRIVHCELPIADIGKRLLAIGHRAASTMTATARARHSRSRISEATSRSLSAGYLLLEVLLALAILTIVVALVFRIIQTTVRVTTDVQYLQAEQEHADGLYELLRKHFDSMPQTAEFQTRRIQNALELVFLEAPFHFSWTSSGPQFGSTVIAARRQADGRYTLAVVQEPEDVSVSYAVNGDPANARWVPIVGGLRECEWRFFDGRAREWKTDWRDAGTKPLLFECTFEVGGQAGPTRAVFRWPVAQIQQ